MSFSLARKLLPPIIVDALRAGKRLLRADTRSSHADSARRAAHAALNARATDEFVFREGLSFRLHPDSVVPFEYFCYRDEEMAAEMDCFLRLTADRRALLDIGSLHGAFTVPFAVRNTASRVLAVDASPFAFAHLLYNLHRNDLSNVVPVECALSDSHGVLEMHLEWQHAVAASTARPEGVRSIRVRKVTGDELCFQNDFAPDVVKIDVEGHEIKVLRGLAQTLEQNRPLVFLEIHPARIAAEDDQIDELREQCSRLGYRARRLGGEAFELHDLHRLAHDERLVFLP